MPNNHVPVLIEVAVLDVFWRLVRDGADTLELLTIFAAQPVTRTSEWNFDSVREHAVAANTELSAEKCFSCNTYDRRLYWHHVIQIHHGGSNHPRNRVAICLRCHATIHPWLPKDRKGEQRGGEWWALAEIGQDEARRETAIGDLIEGDHVTRSDEKVKP